MVNQAGGTLPLAVQLKAAVDVPAVLSLLQGRKFQDGDARIARVNELVENTANEVAANVTNAAVPGVFTLAVWATKLGAASYVETALFPEQQGGDSQGEAFYRRFQGVLLRLRELSSAQVTGSFAPATGSFSMGQR